ncbi:hypothetical protein VOLCADRAFT_91083 [Volvox carteri f. nagariensis]|uniref:Pherophorin domain-containing protein n=1 Tax=Volvox carteri f. nagariensis TaxID=3068 RepID=D8TW48_VOLCA|nr:uncharacterized protein VOLCADRAFT_91083 [Volvox carteri f. nagariensis]EFJ48306.1 hypothetical protein VOLCADRAFT_91083 [Volvox carteri f. nagariensis]|eukprot:XP_002950560.1 hypothetical protein VOLCADRAFT_91083 [Volvox carteri f. nagariensis]
MGAAAAAAILALAMAALLSDIDTASAAVSRPSSGPSWPPGIGPALAAPPSWPYLDIGPALANPPSPTWRFPRKPPQPSPARKPPPPSPTSKPPQPSPTSKPPQPSPTSKPPQPSLTSKPPQPSPARKPPPPPPVRKSPPPSPVRISSPPPPPPPASSCAFCASAYITQPLDPMVSSSACPEITAQILSNTSSLYPNGRVRLVNATCSTTSPFRVTVCLISAQPPAVPAIPPSSIDKMVEGWALTLRENVGTPCFTYSRVVAEIQSPTSCLRGFSENVLFCA